MTAAAPSGKPASAKPASAKPASAKPTVEELGIDVAALEWRRSDGGPGSIEIAFADLRAGGAGGAPGGGEWVLMRVAGDPEQRVLVYDRFEWECFLDGVRNGEFDDAQ